MVTVATTHSSGQQYSKQFIASNAWFTSFVHAIKVSILSYTVKEAKQTERERIERKKR